MSGSWVPNIAYIANNIDKVAAKDTNRPLQQLDQRTQYLFDLLQTISGGELLVAKNVTVDASTIPGTPVYFDENTNSFKPGIAAVSVEPGNNYGFPSDASVIRGIVLTKYGTSAGDIALVGRIKNDIWGIDWTQVTENGLIDPGIYYLSALTNGKLATSRSNLSVYLGSMDSAGDFILNPVVNGNLRDHLHYRFVLKPDLVPDTSTEGWAPASEFPDAPVGATYGYVIQQNSELAAQFPPIPVDAHYFEFEGRGVHKDAYLLNADGLWWMSATAPDILTEDSNFPTPTYDRYYVLWITRLNFGAPFVSTLTPSVDPDVLPVEFTDANGNAASSGNLLALLRNSILAQSGLEEGGLALKRIDGVKGYFGPVIGRVFAGAGVTVEGEFGDDVSGWYGNIVVTSGSSAEVTGLPVLVSLNNAAEDFYGSLPVITFPELRVSSVYMKVSVPTNIPTGRKIKLVLDVIGVGAGAITLNVAYNKVSIGAAINQTEISLANLTPTLIANQAVRVQTASVDIAAGDTIFFRITQPNGALANAVPLLRIQYSIART